MKHLSGEQIERYLAKQMEAGQLWEAGAHLEVCQECRERLEQRLPEWREVVTPHLTFEDLTACLEHRGDAWAAGHLESCAVCAADLEELRMTARGIAAAAVRPAGAWWKRWPALALVATALVVLVIAMWRKPVAELEVAELPKLALPEALERLRPPDGVLLGGNTAPGLRVVSPVATYVAEARPVLRWNGVAGASRYEVEVYDAQFERVARGETAGTEWRVEQDLPSGAVLQWRVTAVVGTERIAAPQPPAPEARFVVLDEMGRAAWDRLRREHGGDAVRLGILAANLGLREEALRLVEGKAAGLEQKLDW